MSTANLSLLLPLALLLACDGGKETTETEPLTTDADADGYGPDEDCDDGNAAVNPGAAEQCDEIDNNCDGQVDEGAAATFYLDADSDGYGEDATTLDACDAPDGYVAEGGDCNDTDTDYNPGAEEDDCTDPNDYNCDGSTGYADDDSDGVAACEDCDDGNAAVNPDATEECDEVDNDCDGAIDAQDDDVEGASVWYTDGDSDGFGDEDDAVVACDQPTGTVEDDTDCDDDDASINPDGEEICGGEDEDCDGKVDEDGASESTTVYRDNDNDGYGDSTDMRETCGVPAGYVEDSTDCDDGDKDVNPGESELCNNVDDDCDAEIDEDSAADAGTWYLDADSDGYGDPDFTDVACDQPSGYSASNKDCDDANAGVSPADAEIAYDGIDQNCSGADLTDVDGDGYDALEVSGDDCDDTNKSANPGEDEVCDSVDNDCDGDIDEDSAIDADTWYADADADDYGDDGVSLTQCDQPDGYVLDGGDCDEEDDSVNPGMDELCADSTDNDCDGLTDDGTAADAVAWHPDLDGDGYGDEDEETLACDAPDDHIEDGSDCDDDDPAVFEGCSSGVFDGTTGTSWQKLAISTSQYPNSLMSYHTSDFAYVYNICYGTARYDPAADAWSTATASPPYSCSWASPAPYAGELWMIRNGSVYNYDPVANVWTTMTSYTGSDSGNMTVSDEDGIIYGYNNAGQIVAYDSATGSVTYYTTGAGGLTQARLAYDPTDNALFFGGAFASTLYRFDLDTHAVTATTPHPESFVSDTFCGDQSGHIYAAGAGSGTTIWQYDIAADSWSKIPDLPSDQGVNGSCTVSEDGWLYVGVPESSILAFYRIELY